MKVRIPEEAMIDAALFDPLAAAAVLTELAGIDALHAGGDLLGDIGRKENLPPQRFQAVLSALVATGALTRLGDGYSLAISREDAARHAAVLRGAGYARHRHKDANQIEITLSPPAHPSQLMEMLPKQGFSWARLLNTKDSLIELASEARKRFIIISPFLDDEGVEWVAELFDAARTPAAERILVVRGRDEREVEVLRSRRASFTERGVRILTYAIAHDPGLRSPAIETFHAKILMADTHSAYIGSANMTRWSRDYSMECGVIVRGPAVKPVGALVDAILRVADEWRGA